MQTAVAAAAVLVSMGILDALWLGTVTSRFYRPQLGDLLAESPSWAPAIAFYLLYAAGVLVLVVLPALDRDRTLVAVALTGAALGLVAFGTYDLTNHATLRTWSTAVTVVDMAWGATMTATVSTLAVLVARNVG